VEPGGVRLRWNDVVAEVRTRVARRLSGSAAEWAQMRRVVRRMDARPIAREAGAEFRGDVRARASTPPGVTALRVAGVNGPRRGSEAYPAASVSVK